MTPEEGYAGKRICLHHFQLLSKYPLVMYLGEASSSEEDAISTSGDIVQQGVLNLPSINSGD